MFAYSRMILNRISKLALNMLAIPRAIPSIIQSTPSLSLFRVSIKVDSCHLCMRSCVNGRRVVASLCNIPLTIDTEISRSELVSETHTVDRSEEKESIGLNRW